MGVQRWGDPAWPGCSRASAADGSTMLQSNSHGSRVHSQTQFMGSVEKESFLSRRREELTRSRIAEVRKQESQQTKQSISKVKEEQARIREEERLLEEYRVFQEKERERERLEKEREEVLKAWRENQLRAEREEKEERDRKELEEKKRAIGLVKQRERGKEALEREEEARRAREKEEWDKRALKDKISREEAARAELAAKEAREREEKRRLEEQKRKLDEESDIRRMRGDVLNGYAAHRKRFGMKEFENSNSRVGGVGPLVVKEEDEDQEDAAVLAQEAATQQKFENEFKREREAVSRERARSREKLAFEREQLEKERTEMEKRSQAEKIKIEQAKVEMAREGERNRLIGMKQREEEAREEVKRQRRLEQDFENLFFGISREVGDEYLGERIAYQAFWKDPCEILYETKKTREWGPKNKKRDLNVPDLDKLVAERRVSRERSRESRDQSDPSRSRSPKVVVGPAGGRNTARTRSGLENDEEVSFHCTEVESEYGREQSYARQRLLEKYRGRDPRDSLEMTLSEDQSVMPRASGYGSLGTDMSRFLEEQERMIQRLERDRAELNKQIQQQENANRAVPRASEPFGDQNGSYEGGDAQNEEDLSGRVLYTNDVGRQPWMHMQDGHQAHTDEEEEEPEPRPEDDEILGKFLTFQPDSKCR